MQVSEMLLRIGSSLVGWMIMYAYFIWLAVLQKAGCQMDSTEMHRLLIGMFPFAIGASFFIGLTRPLEEIHRVLRWLAVPVIILSPFVLKAIWSVLISTTLNGRALCGQGELTTWQILWAPVTFAGVGVSLWMIVAVVRSARIAR